MIRIFKVEGNSLYPLLQEGERIFCFRTSRFSQLKTGDFVVFTQKPHGLMIKRIERLEGKRYFVQGTDPMSIDSRDFGALALSDIQYKAIPIQKSLQALWRRCRRIARFNSTGIQ